MPELPEVETIRRGLASRFRTPRLDHVTVREARLRRPVPQRRLDSLRGCRLVRFGRRAKYLLVETDRGSTIVMHLGMSGRVVVTDPAAPLDRHDHVLFGLAEAGGGDVELRLRDPRRFGLIEVVPTRELPGHELFVHLGPEPLGDDFSVAYAHERTRGRRAPVKNVLMDARFVVGVGNIYASEALWQAGIHPRRAAGRIARARWDRLVESVRGVLGAAIEAGGTTLRDYRDSEGNLGYFAADLSVYARASEPCRRCSRAVRRIVQGARATYYCPGCQR